DGMSIKVAIHDFLGVSIVIGNDLIVEIGVKCRCIEADDATGCERHFFDEIQVPVPRGFGGKLRLENEFAGTSEGGMIVGKHIGYAVTVTEAQAEHMVLVGRIPLVIDSWRNDAAVDAIVIIPPTEQQLVGFVERNLILYKHTWEACVRGPVDRQIQRISSGGGVVVVIGIPVGESGEQIVFAKHFVPCELPEADILVGQERHIAVYAVLVVSVYTELEKN